MILLTEQKLEKAVMKARAEKPRVKFLSYRNYQVTNKKTGATYRVRFEKLNGKPHGNCECAAGRQGRFVCKHIAAAVGHHLLKAAEQTA